MGSSPTPGIMPTVNEQEDWEDFFSFLREEIMHELDDETMEWFDKKLRSLEEIIFDA